MINNGALCEHASTVLSTDRQMRSAGGANPHMCEIVLLLLCVRSEKL